MRKPVIKHLLFVSMLAVTGVSHADGFFGNNNSGFGNFFGGNNGYNNWPVWTPMYWMEEMTGNNFRNNNRYPNSNYYGNRYPQTPYQSSAYGMNPYMGTSPYANPYAVGQNSYVYRPAPTLRNNNTYPQNSFSRSGFSSFSSPFSGNRSGSFPNMNFGNGFSSNPFSSTRSPMSMGSGFPNMNSMSPMSGVSGFGSPFSPMSPMSMGTMGMPGMSPMNSFGGSPFGGNSFMPFGR